MGWAEDVSNFGRRRTDATRLDIGALPVEEGGRPWRVPLPPPLVPSAEPRPSPPKLKENDGNAATIAAIGTIILIIAIIALFIISS